MHKPRCIRIFSSKSQAMRAQNILKEAGITSKISEDKFGKLSLPQLGIKPRFRLYIEQADIQRAAAYLAIQIRKSRLKN